MLMEQKEGKMKDAKEKNQEELTALAGRLQELKKRLVQVQQQAEQDKVLFELRVLEESCRVLSTTKALELHEEDVERVSKKVLTSLEQTIEKVFSRE